MTAFELPEDLVFDTILIRAGDAWHQLGVAEFFALPLSTRIRHVIEQTVAFQLAGNEVDAKYALNALREAHLKIDASRSAKGARDRG